MLPHSFTASNRESSSGECRGGEADEDVDEGNGQDVYDGERADGPADNDSSNEDGYRDDVRKFVENETF